MLFAIAFSLAIFFTVSYIVARNEPPSVDSGTNLLVTVIMVIVPCGLVYLAVQRKK